MRSSSPALRADDSLRSNDAPRTQRDIQWYQRATETSINCLRAIVTAESPGRIPHSIHMIRMLSSVHCPGDRIKIMRAASRSACPSTPVLRPSFDPLRPRPSTPKRLSFDPVLRPFDLDAPVLPSMSFLRPFDLEAPVPRPDLEAPVLR